MVDELMLRDVKNILKKLELIRTREDFEQILLDDGLTNASKEEIDEFIVKKFMSPKEVELFSRYMLYKRREDLSNLMIAIDSFSELTSNITSLYDENSRCKSTINLINGIIGNVDAGLRDYPNIRVSTAYSRVKSNYKRYFDAYIKDGMDRAKFTEEIDDINHSGIIVRGLKKRRLKQLREGLEEHNKNSKLHVDSLYEGYISSRDEYGVYLREVMSTLLKKNSTLMDAGLLSLSSMYHEDIPVKTLSNGVTVVDKSKMKDRDITPEYIASKAFEYFHKIDEPDFDEKMFIKAFRDFLLHFYNAEIVRLEREANGALKGIRTAFNQQRNITRMMSTYQEAVEIPTVTIDQDSKDTFALVYRNN